MLVRDSRWSQWVLVPWAVLVGACASTPEKSPTGQYRLDSATQACRQRPDLCARIAGEEAIVPTVRSAEAVASAVRTGAVVLRVLDAATRELVEKELKACAYAGATQERIYQEALKAQVKRIVPRLGVVP